MIDYLLIWIVDALIERTLMYKLAIDSFGRTKESLVKTPFTQIIKKEKAHKEVRIVPEHWHQDEAHYHLS